MFCRELLSNAADALEKRRHLGLLSDVEDIAAADATSTSPSSPLEIRIAVDKERKELTIQDFGVGMSDVEMMEFLGTIARSGTLHTAASSSARCHD